MIESYVAKPAGPFEHMNHTESSFHLANMYSVTVLLIHDVKASDVPLVNGICEYYQVGSGRRDLGIDGCGPKIAWQALQRLQATFNKKAQLRTGTNCTMVTSEFRLGSTCQRLRCT